MDILQQNPSKVKRNQIISVKSTQSRFIMRKMLEVLTFEFVNEFQKRDHSNLSC